MSTLAIVLLAQVGYAQFKAGIQGTVTDPSGGVIPGVTVTITNNETGKVQEVMSTDAGFYRVSALSPGAYTVSAELPGFRKSVLKDVVVNAEETKGVNIVLEVGAPTETVTVTGEQLVRLRTEDANVSRAISTKEVLRLPQVGRDPYELVRLTPGIFGNGARSGNGNAVTLGNTTGPGGSNTSVFQVENQVPISANGQRVSANNFQIDGVSVNALGWGGAAVVTPNQESVKEVQVLSTSYSAEDGRNSGAQIKVVSQNGTNEFHGSGLFKYNDPKLNAFNKWGGPTGTPSIDGPPLRVERRFRQFGGSLGGPVYLPWFGDPPYFSGRNRLFFFFSYEGLRENTDNPYTGYVETPEYRELVKRLRPDSVTAKILGSSGIEPRIITPLAADCSIFGANAATNCRAVTGGLDLGSLTGARGTYVTPATGGGFDGSPDIMFAQFARPSTVRGDQFNTRVDYTKGNDTVAVSTYFTRRRDFGSDSGARSRPSSDLGSRPFNTAVTLTYNRILSARILNEARVNGTRFAHNQLKASEETDFGIPRVEVEGLPFDRIRFGAPRGETTPGIFAQNTFEFRDTVSMLRGNHAWKFGVEMRRELDNNNLAGGARPVYSFVGLFNLANDTPIFEAINADPNDGLPADAQRYFRTGANSFFVQNDWKVRTNLTVNLGLRYEYSTPLREKRGRLSKLIFGPNGLVDSRVVVTDELFKPDRNNFAPRLGFAYSPKMFDNKLVLRGGFGIAYNRVPGVLYLNSRGNPPFFARFSLCCGNADNPFVGGSILYTLGTSRSPSGYPVNPALARGIDPATGGPRGGAVEIYGTPPELANAYVYTFSLDVQYELPSDLLATLGYQGSSGHKLIRIVNQNYLFANNVAFNPVFFLFPDVNSNFHSLNARLSHRFARGFQADASYRFAKSIDTLSYEGPGFITNQTNPADLRSERGPSDFDAKHYFNLSGLWDVPILSGRSDFLGKAFGGWQVNGILTAHTGLPWTPVTRRASLTTPGGRVLSPIRPIAYFGGALADSSNDAFMRVGGNFPGGGARYFELAASGAPGIGRNSFRGPGFFSVDLSLVKQTGLPTFLGLGEEAKLEFRANLFNAFNKLNLQQFGFASNGTIVEDNRFGRSGGGLAGRMIEFQARLSF
ncbi:MAG: TonB-dependent receptor domain-containing protein [Gammaproteobacteria bacterium]